VNSGWPALADNGAYDAPKSVVIEVLHPAPLPPPQKRVRLGTIREIRGELAKVYREARSGKIDTATATRLAYLLDLMSRMIERSELEERVAVLESKSDR
jgi:hypothetical protein